jgi:hypothetical protein
MREHDTAEQLTALYQRAKALQQHGAAACGPSEQGRVAALETQWAVLVEELHVALEALLSTQK